MRGMKRSVAVLILLLGTTVASAATSPAPDYSRETILKVLHDSEAGNQRFKINAGTVDINTAAMRYHFAYLPLLAPLPYSGPQGARFLPNPFVLTHTEYAWRPHQFQGEPDGFHDPEYRREYRRTLKELRRQHIVVTR